MSVHFNSHIGSHVHIPLWEGGTQLSDVHKQLQQLYNHNKINILISESELLPVSKELS